MRRAVLDANLLVSAFLTPERGPAAAVLQFVREGALVACLCDQIAHEARRVLTERPRLIRVYAYDEGRVRDYMSELREIAVWVERLPPLLGVVRDPNDDMVVACAVAAKAGWIVTRDNDLLSLGS